MRPSRSRGLTRRRSASETMTAIANARRDAQTQCAVNPQRHGSGSRRRSAAAGASESGARRQRPVNRLVGIGDGKGLAIHIPDDLRHRAVRPRPSARCVRAPPAHPGCARCGCCSRERRSDSCAPCRSPAAVVGNQNPSAFAQARCAAGNRRAPHGQPSRPIRDDRVSSGGISSGRSHSVSVWPQLPLLRLPPNTHSSTGDPSFGRRKLVSSRSPGRAPCNCTVIAWASRAAEPAPLNLRHGAGVAAPDPDADQISGATRPQSRRRDSPARCRSSRRREMDIRSGHSAGSSAAAPSDRTRNEVTSRAASADMTRSGVAALLAVEPGRSPSRPSSAIDP